ncbi:hypothetical protein JDN40_11455 [Rhodomicrobium vannielii ATCC 17100]|uniref:hypothetical protein n=1 Tax=Rhodomicrobium vannielii TaxID=1069 RepID=UPI00191B383B|nr:hypothetical protein [Rhodomicrobium vannielii]MBJ7534722.1 hypothetical protein [Rhodomicrobium vannielii ATCC 17100]
MRLVFKAPDTLPPVTSETPRWPDRPEGFALSVSPRGSDPDWPEFASQDEADARSGRQMLPRPPGR